MNRANTLQFLAPFPITNFMDRGVHLLSLAFFLVIIFSCTDKTNQNVEEKGKIKFHFDHTINHSPIVFDTIMYTNSAGNPYLINEIQYFISDVRLYSNNGNEKIIDDWKDIHYIDTDINSTLSWEVYDAIEPGQYDSISFTFGISAEKNMSFMFVNAPEKDMFWPEFLGGGYHYMKLNGKWLPENASFQTIPFDFHLGIGQVYYNYPDSITGYVHNNFDVSLPASNFSVEKGATREIKITMDVANWFAEPHVYDHDVYGGYIMQNQDAMLMVKENGFNVFSFEEIPLNNND